MFKTLIFDLDGTLYRGKTPVPGAVDTLQILHTNSLKLIFMTNAASRSRASLAKKLSDMGLPATVENCYPTSYILAEYIKKHHPQKSAYIIGQEGMSEEFERAGIDPASENAQIVVVGLDKHFTYNKLYRAYDAITKGALFFASNKDHTFPTEHGFIPGCGSIVAAIEYATKKEAFTIGKPKTYAMEIIKRDHHFNERDVLVVGDRLDTDIAFAKNSHLSSALVLTGNSKKSDIKDIKPDFVLESVADLPRLFTSHPHY